MEDVLVTIEILIKSLEQKKKMLLELKDYTKLQSEILLKEPMDYAKFNNIIENKQARIDGIIDIDSGFIPTYERISSRLKNNKSLYNEEIRAMKKLISEINDVQIAINVGEERNKKMFNEKVALMKTGAKTYRNRNDALKKYKGSDKGTSRSSFFDSQN